MFFSKRETTPDNRRETYRKRQSRAHKVDLQVVSPSGTTRGEFIDISVSGLGARFPYAGDPRLADDDVIELRIECGQNGSVQTPARVVYSREDGKGQVRYGFEFINEGNLYSQLDSFFSRLFNRRNSVRIRPSLDKEVKMQLAWKGHRVEAVVSEISASGSGIVLPITATYQIQGVDEVEVSFDLPGLKHHFKGRARVCGRKASAGKVFVGLAFAMEGPGSFAGVAKLLERFVDERAREMVRWDRSWA